MLPRQDTNECTEQGCRSIKLLNLDHTTSINEVRGQSLKLSSKHLAMISAAILTSLKAFGRFVSASP
jgi:hypothetical protein